MNPRSASTPTGHRPVALAELGDPPPPLPKRLPSGTCPRERRFIWPIYLIGGKTGARKSCPAVKLRHVRRGLSAFSLPFLSAFWNRKAKIAITSEPPRLATHGRRGRGGSPPPGGGEPSLDQNPWQGKTRRRVLPSRSGFSWNLKLRVHGSSPCHRAKEPRRNEYLGTHLARQSVEDPCERARSERSREAFHRLYPARTTRAFANREMVGG